MDTKSMTERDWFDGHVYGREPREPEGVVLRDGVLSIEDGGRMLDVQMRVELPAASRGVVVVLNFRGNEETFGNDRHQYPVEQIHAAGWGLATARADDFAPDDPERWRDGVHALLGLSNDADDATRTLALWAWGLSRMADGVLGLEGVERVVALGHSRMGKAALLAAYRDERFAAVVSNQSGCGGAALFRRKTGERIADITRQFPHWFCRRFDGYAGKDDELPFDQDALLKSVAPRPVLVRSAADDAWADPEAERRCAEVSGAEYSIRPGEHNLTASDWEAALAFLNRRLP
ncbi:MAG: hypothetical protein AAGI46_15180 [Planctomycetota bacterium]